MWLQVGTVGYIEVDFWHSHDGHHHLHDANVAASVEAHGMAHRLASFDGDAEPRIR